MNALYTVLYNEIIKACPIDILTELYIFSKFNKLIDVHIAKNKIELEREMSLHNLKYLKSFFLIFSFISYKISRSR